MNAPRIAVYVVTALLGIFGVVFVADALVATDEEHLAELESALLHARPDRRADAVAGWFGSEDVAVVADGERTWIDADESRDAVRGAILDALPELDDPQTEWVDATSELTGHRARITLRLRDRSGSAPAYVDATIELALDDGHFSLLEVRRLRS